MIAPWHTAVYSAVHSLDPVPEAKDVTPGWIYAVVVLALIIVTVLLWLNMRKQLKKIDFDDGSGTPDDSVDRQGPTQGPPA